MLQAIATGLAYGGLAKMTTNANLEEALVYASCNVILRNLAWKASDVLMGQTEVDQILKTLFVTAASIQGGFCISKLYANRLTKHDLRMLNFSAMLISSSIALKSMVDMAQLIECKV